MLMEGAAPADVAPRLRRDLPDMVRSNWLLWVPFQFLNFRFVPPQLQASSLPAATLLLWAACCSFCKRRAVTWL